MNLGYGWIQIFSFPTLLWKSKKLKLTTVILLSNVSRVSWIIIKLFENHFLGLSFPSHVPLYFLVLFHDVCSFKDPVQWLYSRPSTHTWWIHVDVSWVSQCEGKMVRSLFTKHLFVCKEATHRAIILPVVNFEWQNISFTHPGCHG